MPLIREADIREAIYDLLCYGPASYREIATSLGLHLRTVKVVIRDHFEDIAFVHGDVVALASFWRRADGVVTLASIHTGYANLHPIEKPGQQRANGSGGGAA